MHRSYAVLTVKAVEEDQRIIRGTATTPAPDRMGDIVEPAGVTFKNPVPLLWHHDSRSPVGRVTLERPTKDGVFFEAKIEKEDEPGTLKDRLDEAWQSVKRGLVKGVSIGFQSLEDEPVNPKDRWAGTRFLKSEVVELSLVTIPANIDATISQIKAYDALNAIPDIPQSPAVAGTRARPAVAGIPLTPITQAPKDARNMKTYAEQREAVETRVAALEKEINTIQTKTVEENRTKTNEEREEFERLMQERDGLELELKDLRKLEELNKSRAVPVVAETPAKATESRTASPYGSVSVKSNLPEGIPFVRWCIAVTRSKIWNKPILDVIRAEKSWYNSPELETMASVDGLDVILRAAQGAGTTTDATFAAPLVVATNVASAFAEYLRPYTIIGRIPGLRRVPFNITVPRATSGATVGWVGEQAPKPVSGLAFDQITMRWAKAAGIVVLSDELVRFSNPSAEDYVRTDLRNTMTQFLDKQFVDPSVAAVTNVSPASITNGVTAIVPTGSTAAALRADLNTLWANFYTNNIPTSSGVFIGTQRLAGKLSTTLNSLGQQLFPTLTPDGGTLYGYPYIASENIPSTTGSPIEGAPLIFAIASEIMLADDGQSVVDASREAALQMDTTPDSPATASTVMTSMFQTNQVALRVERWINWQKRRSQAVQYIQAANYGE